MFCFHTLDRLFVMIRWDHVYCLYLNGLKSNFTLTRMFFSLAVSGAVLSTWQWAPLCWQICLIVSPPLPITNPTWNNICLLHALMKKCTYGLKSSPAKNWIWQFLPLENVEPSSHDNYHRLPLQCIVKRLRWGTERWGWDHWRVKWRDWGRCWKRKTSNWLRLPAA